jgi:hypothetical protein
MQRLSANLVRPGPGFRNGGAYPAKGASRTILLVETVPLVGRKSPEMLACRPRFRKERALSAALGLCARWEASPPSQPSASLAVAHGARGVQAMVDQDPLALQS